VEVSSNPMPRFLPLFGSWIVTLLSNPVCSTPVSGVSREVDIPPISLLVCLFPFNRFAFFSLASLLEVFPQEEDFPIFFFPRSLGLGVLSPSPAGKGTPFLFPGLGPVPYRRVN